MKTELKLKSEVDGIQLSAVVVEPEHQKPEAVLQIAHGVRGCKERYLPFMDFMADHGVACVACDHRGHGGSIVVRKDLGYLDGGYEALIQDMKLVTDWAAKHFHDIPIVLLGHSMGSMAARLYAKKYDWELSGMILSGSPGYNRMARPTMLLTGFLCLFDNGRMRPIFLQEYISSRLNRKFSSEDHLAWVCSDENSRKDMLANPLNNFPLTVNMMHNLLEMMVQTHSRRGWKVLNPELPITFLSGADDEAMGGEKKLHDAAMMMTNVGYNNVSAAIFSNMRHEILNEIDKEVVWNDILDFIMKIQTK